LLTNDCAAAGTRLRVSVWETFDLNQGADRISFRSQADSLLAPIRKARPRSNCGSDGIFSSDSHAKQSPSAAPAEAQDENGQPTVFMTAGGCEIHDISHCRRSVAEAGRSRADIRAVLLVSHLAQIDFIRTEERSMKPGSETHMNQMGHVFSPWGMADWLSTWGYLGVFICLFIGNLGVPLPEETVLLAAGFLAGRKALGLWTLYLVGITSAVTADCFGFRIWVYWRTAAP
jgi:hypothetical protein